MTIKIVRRNDWHTLLLIAAILSAIALKVALLMADVIQMNADEAIVALMARHILKGARPIFFYGQAYMGSLDALLVALGFRFFGEHVAVIRGLQVLLYVMTIITTYMLGKEVYRSSAVGVLAAWFLAIPTVNMTLYTTVSLGGYGEAILLGNSILLLTLWIANSIKEKKRYFLSLFLFFWGVLCGFGFWVFGMTLVYSIPSFVYLGYYLVRNARKQQEDSIKFIEFIRLLMVIVVGVMLGSLPWFFYAFQYGFQSLVSELGGSAIASVENIPWIKNFFMHIINFLLFGIPVIIGLRPPWGTSWLAMPLLPLAMIFWSFVVVYTFGRLRFSIKNRDALMLLLGVCATLIAGFIMTPFGADPSGRYFLPIGIIISLMGASAIHSMQARWQRWAWGVFGIILVYNLWGTIQCARVYPPGITTQFDAITQINHDFDKDLIDFLLSEGERTGYTNYWVAYPLAFHSCEQLIFVPRLPYHQDFRYTDRDNRYKEYEAIVNASPKVAYITTNHPQLNQYLRNKFTELGIHWKEKYIGDYQIFYALSSAIRPQQLGLSLNQDK